MGVFSAGKSPTLDHPGKALPFGQAPDLDPFTDRKNIHPDFVAYGISRFGIGGKFLQMHQRFQTLFLKVTGPRFVDGLCLPGWYPNWREPRPAAVSGLI